MTIEDALLGSDVGRYRIVRAIGRGGMGNVYEGVQADVGAAFAVKVISEKYAQNPEALERFFAEARAANVIAHENIVKVHDLAKLPDGRPYIVMELLAGKTLRDYVRGGPLPIGGVVHVALEVLSALAATHAAGIVHRDLKADNIFITAKGRAKVLDFGIAKLGGVNAVSRTQTGVVLGTPEYMAPEQITQGIADGRTDLYALGVVLFEALVGRRPFERKTDFDLMRAHVEVTPPRACELRAEVPAAIDHIVACALAKDPRERFASAGAMANALQQAMPSISIEQWRSIAPGGRLMSPRPPSMPPAIELPNSDARKTVVDMRASEAGESRAGATMVDRPARASSSRPTAQPSRAPSGHPSRAPSAQPARAPSAQPSRAPSAQPSRAPAQPRAPSTERRAASTEPRAASTERRVVSARPSAPSVARKARRWPWVAASALAIAAPIAAWFVTSGGDVETPTVDPPAVGTGNVKKPSDKLAEAQAVDLPATTPVNPSATTPVDLPATTPVNPSATTPVNPSDPTRSTEAVEPSPIASASASVPGPTVASVTRPTVALFEDTPTNDGERGANGTRVFGGRSSSHGSPAKPVEPVGTPIKPTQPTGTERSSETEAADASAGFIERPLTDAEQRAGLRLHGLYPSAERLAHELERDAKLVEIQLEMSGDEEPRRILFFFYSETPANARCIRVRYQEMEPGRARVTAVRINCAAKTPVALPRCTYPQIVAKVPKNPENHVAPSGILHWSSHGWTYDGSAEVPRLEDCK